MTRLGDFQKTKLKLTLDSLNYYKWKIQTVGTHGLMRDDSSISKGKRPYKLTSV